MSAGRTATTGPGLRVGELVRVAEVVRRQVHGKTVLVRLSDEREVSLGGRLVGVGESAFPTARLDERSEVSSADPVSLPW